MVDGGYLDIAAAILTQAKDDYIYSLKHHHERSCANLERFFLSDWGQMLSFNHGEYIIEQCKKIVEEYRQEEWRKQHPHKM